jgi:hypothetical protein
MITSSEAAYRLWGGRIIMFGAYRLQTANPRRAKVKCAIAKFSICWILESHFGFLTLVSISWVFYFSRQIDSIPHSFTSHVPFSPPNLTPLFQNPSITFATVQTKNHLFSASRVDSHFALQLFLSSTTYLFSHKKSWAATPAWAARGNRNTLQI